MIATSAPSTRTDGAAQYHPIVQKLVDLIKANGWQDKFNQTLKNAECDKVEGLHDIKSLDDYLRYINDLLTWVPKQQGDSHSAYKKIVEFYYLLDQEPVRSLQNPIQPGVGIQKLTPLSEWIDEYAKAWGAWLDTEESVGAIESFRTSEMFNWDEYMPPPSGYKTFNQFFARHVKPGQRPVAAIDDPSVLVAPADSTFVGWWQINEKSQINSKGILWSIHQLLEESKYADRFKGGIFTHSFLNTFDYHRWHAPVGGRVVESRCIQGQAFLDVNTIKEQVDGKETLVLNALDNTGYQFVQSRGLAVIDSPIGLVACLPMGMAQVSSVVMTADEGVVLRKGEELGYFQFGGSDFVMVFERASNIQLTTQPGVHYQQGQVIGYAHAS